MSRLLFLSLILTSGNLALGEDTPSQRPLKEPSYEAVPKYARMVLGTDKSTVWMVEDGKRLFVDKNANGDLTDDGPPIEPTDFRNLGNGQWDFNYVLESIETAGGARHTKFDLRRWSYGDKNESYGLSITVDDRIPMYAGWFHSFWSSKPESAPIIPLHGPLTPRLLRAKEIGIGPGAQRISVAFVNRDTDEGAVARLSTEALAKANVPRLRITWPAAERATRLFSTLELGERCCYWEYYSSLLRVPDGAVPGVAKAEVLFPDGEFPLDLTTSVLEIPVILRKPNSQE